MYEVPVGFAYDGSTGVNQSQFLGSAHTAAKPHVLIFKRVQPTTKGTHEVSLRFVKGVDADLIDPEDNEPTNTIIDVVIRNVRNQDETEIRAILDVLSGILADDDFQVDAVTDNRIPRTVASA